MMRNTRFVVGGILLVLSVAAHAGAAVKMIYGERIDQQEYESRKFNALSKWKTAQERRGAFEALSARDFRDNLRSYAVIRRPHSDQDVAEAVAGIRREAARFDFEHGVRVIIDKAAPRFPTVLMTVEGRLKDGRAFPTATSVEARPMIWAGTSSADGQTSGWSGAGLIFDTLTGIGNEDVAAAKATFEMRVPASFQTVELTVAKPSQSGFELLEVRPGLVRIKYDGVVGEDFSYDFYSVGRPVAADDVDKMGLGLSLDLLLTRDWKDLPDVLGYPSSGVMSFVTAAPVDRVVIFRSSARKTVTLQSQFQAR